MNKRILIGNAGNGKTGLWISKQGYEAGDITKPHIFSCDNSYLEVHSAGRALMEVTKMGKNDYDYYWRLDYGITFPYIPMAFISVRIDVNSSSDTVYFPAIPYGDWRPAPTINTDSANIYVPRVPMRRNAFVTWIIFKNRSM